MSDRLFQVEVREQTDERRITLNFLIPRLYFVSHTEYLVSGTFSQRELKKLSRRRTIEAFLAMVRDELEQAWKEDA